MATYVPVPHFGICALGFKNDILQAALETGMQTLRDIRKAALAPKEVLGTGDDDPRFIGGMYLPGGKAPITHPSPWMHLWGPWWWALLAYTNEMRDECQRRGLPTPVVPPEWGCYLTFTRLMEWAEHIRVNWPGSDRIIPTWFADERLGRRHKAALVSHDSYYGAVFP